MISKIMLQMPNSKYKRYSKKMKKMNMNITNYCQQRYPKENVKELLELLDLCLPIEIYENCDNCCVCYLQSIYDKNNQWILSTGQGSNKKSAMHDAYNNFLPMIIEEINRRNQ